ncbi:hypothetical protein PSHT_14981 [Puccinia striiformis]|uniref:Uncharacterized protein n=1 Tax=Puccinia striiformis TaxID=27350 RepID=A0A2S4UHF1_9BASI|nr:hypothetical protein PSHT_14981 [Puccinia striiformis]
MDQPEDKAPPKAKRGCPASPPWPLPDTQPKNLSEAEECFKRHEFSKRQRTFILGVVGLIFARIQGQEANIDHELDAPGDMANTGVSKTPTKPWMMQQDRYGGAPLCDQGGVLRKLTACKGSSAPREKKRRARNTPDIFFRCQAPNELRNFTKVLGIPQAERMLEHLHVILGIFPDGVPSQCPPGIAFARAGIWVNDAQLFEIPTSYLDVSLSLTRCDFVNWSKTETHQTLAPPINFCSCDLRIINVGDGATKAFAAYSFYIDLSCCLKDAIFRP